MEEITIRLDVPNFIPRYVQIEKDLSNTSEILLDQKPARIFFPCFKKTI